MVSGQWLVVSRAPPFGADHSRVKLPISFKDEPRMNTNRHEYRWTSLAATPSRNEAHPGARASRPHAPPLRVAQYVYDVAAGHPGGGNGVGWAKQIRGVFADRAGWRRCGRLCGDKCGRDARAPGWTSSDADLRIRGIGSRPFPEKILCILCIDVIQPLTPALL